MEQLFTQYPALPMVMLLGAYELAKFLGKQGWAWLTGVASRSVTKDACLDCKNQIKADLQVGDDLFLLLLEGQALQTQAILQMCNPAEEECQEIIRGLKAHNLKLVTHRERRHGHAQPLQ